MTLLSGQTAIISGGLGDIGRAIARRLGEMGAAVAIGDIAPPERAAEFLEKLHVDGINVVYHAVDVADAAAVQEWVENVENTLGTPTLIIPNAATVTLADIRTVTAQQWERELSINLNGSFHLAQTAAVKLLEKGSTGRIVFIGSWAAHAPHPKIPAYSVSKAALRMLSRCMALDLAPQGILVNEVAPGYVDAGLSGRIFDEQPDLRDQSRAKVPVRRLISPREVALQVAHLCDPENQHMTGSTLLMDGGLSLLTP
jgi:NAD(P)-dependent dehydrogenase (short-subunit alcohol dehydrogenase family)